ncbi:SDR family oxidoreductase [Allostreptomyces psammosilenae]|uniref:Uncharacterized protein n=1 Tax=Allostreptomyces psammosilenae TaxID=1892865 RepID=A0A853A478_9ACTN|nr:hypothetical protein [Allostreptomyces psammosilenae]
MDQHRDTGTAVTAPATDHDSEPGTDRSPATGHATASATDPDTLRGRVALVTGAGTGIGRATARALAADGARVVALGRRPEPLAECAEADPDAIRPLVADVTAPGAPERIVGDVLRDHDRLDVLVNNAAVVRGGELETLWRGRRARPSGRCATTSGRG